MNHENEWKWLHHVVIVCICFGCFSYVEMTVNSNNWLVLYHWFQWYDMFIYLYIYISFIIYHLSFIIYYISYITYHISHITCHMSYVIYHISYIIYHISLLRKIREYCPYHRGTCQHVEPQAKPRDAQIATTKVAGKLSSENGWFMPWKIHL